MKSRDFAPRESTAWPRARGPCSSHPATGDIKLQDASCTTSIDQTAHQDSNKKSGLWHILLHRKSCLRGIYSVFYLISRFNGSEQYWTSNAQCAQQHYLYKTVIKELLNHKPFACKIKLKTQIQA